MNGCVRAGGWLALALCLGACSTLSGDFHQKLQIDALDAENHAVDGMQCQIGTGASAKTVVTPAIDVRVRRSALPLQIECRRDSLVAAATVKPRRERMEEALLPFGSAGVFVDHLSGALYSYPTALHLRVGQRVVLEHGEEAKIATSEPFAVPPKAGPASAQRIQVATVQPSASAEFVGPPAPFSQKPRPAAAAKSSHSASKQPKTAGSTAVKAQSPAANVQKVAVSAPAAATAAPAAVHIAPVNW